MALPLMRYPLDRTGVNPDNLVKDEVHTLNNRPNRIIVPTHSPYYAESVVIVDTITNKPLVRGTDFLCVELLQEATLKYGKEIAQVILITNTAVSSTVKITYQVLGGLYSFDMSAIVNLYETANLDRRPVDWLNVLNKPYEYPPTLHNHTLEDVYGFEYLIVALERIRSAITVSNVPAYEAIMDWVKSRTLDVVSIEEIDKLEPVHKYVTFDRLLYYMDSLDLCKMVMTVTPNTYYIDNGQVLNVVVHATCLSKDTKYYWTIEHISTVDSDFTVFPLSDVLVFKDKVSTFNVPISHTAIKPNEINQFKINIRRKSLLGRIVASSDIITIKPEGNDMIDYGTACCLYNPMISINADALFFLED